MHLIQMYLSDLKELLEAREFVSLRTALKEISPVDLADGWSHFKPEERTVLFKLSPRQRGLALFEELDPPFQEELVKALKQEEVQELVEDLDPSQTGRLLRKMPAGMVRHLEKFIKLGGQQETIEKLLKYPESSVGALMRSKLLRLDAKWNTKKALERISASTRLRDIAETFLDTLFVTDRQGRLVGDVSLKQLVVAPSAMPIKDLMDERPLMLHPEMDQEEAARLFSRYKLKSAPVVDNERKLLGFVWYKDIFDVVQQETEEDFAKMAGTGAGAGEAATVWEAARIRLPWLAITCLGQLLVSSVIKGFEPTLERLVALATFMPLIAAMGGNVGSQSAIIVVRALSTGEMRMDDGRRTVWKDLRVGAALGLVYCAAMVIVSFAFYGKELGWSFSAVIGLGTALSMSIAASLGAMVPFLFRRFGIDPATATGPLVTTCTDLISTASYLSLATYLLLR